MDNQQKAYLEIIIIGEKSMREIVLKQAFRKQKIKGKKSNNGKYDISNAVIFCKPLKNFEDNFKSFLIKFLQSIKFEIDFNELINKNKNDRFNRRIPIIVLNCNNIMSSNLKIKSNEKQTNGLDIFSSFKSIHRSQQLQILKRLVIILVYKDSDKNDNSAKTKLSLESINTVKQRIMDKIRDCVDSSIDIKEALSLESICVLRNDKETLLSDKDYWCTTLIKRIFNAINDGKTLTMFMTFSYLMRPKGWNENMEQEEWDEIIDQWNYNCRVKIQKQIKYEAELEKMQDNLKQLDRTFEEFKHLVKECKNSYHGGIDARIESRNHLLAGLRKADKVVSELKKKLHPKHGVHF